MNQKLNIGYSYSSAGGLGEREGEGVKVRQKQDHELPFEPSLCVKKGLCVISSLIFAKRPCTSADVLEYEAHI